MLRTPKLLAAAVLVAGSLAAVSAALAQSGQANPPQTAPMSPGASQGQGGMQGHGMMPMMGMMAQMDPAQMNRMMENCNKMMDGMMKAQPGSTATPEKKG